MRTGVKAHSLRSRPRFAGLRPGHRLRARFGQAVVRRCLTLTLPDANPASGRTGPTSPTGSPPNGQSEERRQGLTAGADRALPDAGGSPGAHAPARDRPGDGRIGGGSDTARRRAVSPSGGRGEDPWADPRHPCVHKGMPAPHYQFVRNRHTPCSDRAACSSTQDRLRRSPRSSRARRPVPSLPAL